MEIPEAKVVKRGKATKKKNKEEIEDEVLEEKKGKKIYDHQIFELLLIKIRIEEILWSLISCSSEEENEAISEDHLDDDDEDEDDDDDDDENESSYSGQSINAISFNYREWRQPNLNNVMEALSDTNTHHIIGLYGSNDEIRINDTPLVKICRRIDRDNLFNVVLCANVTKKPNIKGIQDEIAGQLKFNFNEKKSEGKRAIELLHRMKIEHKVLVILCDLHKRLDLVKLGISFGKGCKILLTSPSVEVLSEHMNVQNIFMVS